MGAPVLIGAGIGAATSLATGQNPLQGALLGGIGGGAFGGAGGIGSGFTEGGLFSLGSAIPSAGSAVATSAPTLGGLELAGATTGAVGGATSGGVAATTPYAFGTPTIASDAMVTPPILTTEGAIGTAPNLFDKTIDAITPSGGYDAATGTMGGDNFVSNLVKTDPIGSTMLANSAAQNLLSRPTGVVAPVDSGTVRKGAIKPTVGEPVSILSPADYIPSHLNSTKVNVTDQQGGSLFPFETGGFGGQTMMTGFQDPVRRKFYQ